MKVILLAGDGPHFSAGHDLSGDSGKTWRDFPVVGTWAGFDASGAEARFGREMEIYLELCERWRNLPKPTIAEVQGVATAAGCQLVAACDLAVASDQAAFATPGVKIGLFCSTPMVPLTRAIGRKHAFEMLVTGEMVDAKTAAEWGLVNRVVSAAELPAESRKLALRIASASPLVVDIGKQAFYTQIDLDQPKAYAYAKEVMSMNALAADAQEGISAFLEKRAPCWSGK